MGGECGRQAGMVATLDEEGLGLGGLHVTERRVVVYVSQ